MNILYPVLEDWYFGLGFLAKSHLKISSVHHHHHHHHHHQSLSVHLQIRTADITTPLDKSQSKILQTKIFIKVSWSAVALVPGRQLPEVDSKSRTAIELENNTSSERTLYLSSRTSSLGCFPRDTPSRSESRTFAPSLQLPLPDSKSSLVT